MKLSEELKRNIKRLLRRRIGSHGSATLSVRKVKELTGIAHVEKHCDANSSYYPNAVEMAAYMSVLGAGFINEYLGIIGYGGAYKMAFSETCAMEQMQALIAASGLLTEAIEDGKIDHIERRTMAPIFSTLGARQLSFSAAMSNPIVTITAFRDHA